MSSVDVFAPTPPWLARWLVDENDAHAGLWRLRGKLAGSDIFAGTLRGWRMRTRDGVFEQFAALLQFPRYFGENWNAFADCVRDLDWLRGKGLLLVVLEAADVLAEGDADEFGLLLSVLSDAAASMAEPTDFRAALPFHVVLQAPPERAQELEARVRTSGEEAPLVVL